LLPNSHTWLKKRPRPLPLSTPFKYLKQMAETKISLKLVIDKKRNRVLLAEAGKDFVDFLLEAFTLPVVTVARFLKNEDTAGCLQSLYNSVENLSDSFIQPGRSKDLVLRPKFVTSGDTGSLLPRVDHCTFLKLYRCSKSNCYCRGTYLSSISGRRCLSCDSPMSEEVRIEELESRNKASGNFDFVKESVTYMVMDDLEIKPMSVDPFITLLNDHNLKESGPIEKKVIDLSMDECVKLLKAALQSKTVLTDTFLSSPSETGESIKKNESSDEPTILNRRYSRQRW
ncbi:hypothetical protein F2P56_017736, partial [Juglans regia]